MIDWNVIWFVRRWKRGQTKRLYNLEHLGTVFLIPILFVLLFCCFFLNQWYREKNNWRSVDMCQTCTLIWTQLLRTHVNCIAIFRQWMIHRMHCQSIIFFTALCFPSQNRWSLRKLDRRPLLVKKRKPGSKWSEHHEERAGTKRRKCVGRRQDANAPLNKRIKCRDPLHLTNRTWTTSSSFTPAPYHKKRVQVSPFKGQPDFASSLSSGPDMFSVKPKRRDDRSCGAPRAVGCIFGRRFETGPLLDNSVGLHNFFFKAMAKREEGEGTARLWSVGRAC